jgi:uncharacterized protein (TIGR00297 family)
MGFDLLQFLVGCVLAVAVAAVAYRLHALAFSGAIATAILGTIVFGLGGLAWSLPLITFFVLSSLLSRVGTRGPGSKERFATLFEKGSRRDAGQVIANGGVAGVILLITLFRGDAVLYTAYLGALAAAAADTWGTEIGVLGHGPVISLGTFQRVRAGTSGGVSLAGTLGAAAGALSVALSGLPWTHGSLATLVVVVASGIAGMAGDGAIGALAQARYRCLVCGAITERAYHCEHRTRLVSGRRWINNDTVNVACCIIGALVAYLLSRVV